MATLPTASMSSVQAVTAIDLGGRLSVRYQRDGNEEALHGSFSWSQRADRTLVTLMSPLGQTIATIAITPTEAILTQSGQPARSAADPDALAADALGWPLPVAGLRDWLQGHAKDANGRSVNASPANSNPILTGDGWTLQYASWEASEVAKPARPKRIDLSRSTSAAGNVTIRIIIDSWQPV
ncbi:lipoprotein insertase outer membrane protein LolB [Actimicrobium sp. CCC2.4]|uniref:lipoprotein insertase outer membrane protein LolB n=1 Tax=Actimicrobium sp. CCC2.4 TaxID=3048606 RepID=UPI002AC92556|nr:lipoprotein insertase outer membrane protein LolB [Actimicrobium sp. CCC2.4]MEB0134283.1 lipoprotein insertase outer membrane protein LolB [Actimicrobium sp. CCC2.4]WPX32929.1 lipoprotein insertase outer membrane protein LolB [Actimicrobium sp. CCC2.4]